MDRRRACIALVATILAGCTVGTSPGPSASSQSPVDRSARASSAASSPSPTSPPAPPASPSGSTHPTVQLPVRGSLDSVPIQMIGVPDGGAYVSIADQAGVVLLLLDREGHPRAGWPVRLADTTTCGALRAAADGSVRLVCDALDLPQPDLGGGAERAFAYGKDGRPLPGWPVEVPATIDANVVGDDLVLLADRPLGDSFTDGDESSRSWLVTITPSASATRGEEVSHFARECGSGEWAVGSDGRAYGTELFLDRCEEWDPTVPTWTTLTQLTAGGIPAAWPIRLDGLASVPAVDPSGRILVVRAPPIGAPSTVVAFDASAARTAASAALPITTAEGGELCASSPEPPVVGPDGVAFVNGNEPVIYALDRRLQLLPGWPFRPTADLERHWLGANVVDGCPAPVAPAAGPGGTLAVALAGGQLTSVGRDGRERDGWPVRLRRDGAQWSDVVVASDGTVFGLAIEPEGGGEVSATILAIDPDGTVRGRTTILEP